MSDVEFATASLDEISSQLFSEGAVLLRNFVKVDRLNELVVAANALYCNTSEVHVRDSDLIVQGLPHFHEFVFEDKHTALLSSVFGGDEYRVSDATATRRIDAAGSSGQWQAPLGPHLDAFYHPFPFTVNFWVPFSECGVDAPSLGVVQARFSEIIEFTGYDGNVSLSGIDWKAGEWNFPRFNRSMKMLAEGSSPAAIQEFRAAFADRVWTPTYALGDAMMLSNWTMHFTHVAPNMRLRRANVELRFESNQTLAETIARHAG